MQIREGAYYRTRGGDVVGPMKQTGDQRYPWTAFSEIVGDLLRWTPEGDYSYAAENPHDLISEVYVSDTPPTNAPAPEAKTLRDEFAIAALTGMIAADHEFTDRIAEETYEIADAMMEARNK
jgi:hypothetical protein